MTLNIASVRQLRREAGDLREWMLKRWTDPEKIKKSPKEFTKANDILVIPDFTIEPPAAKSLINEIVNYIPSVKKVFCCACFEDIQLNEIKKRVQDLIQSLLMF